MRVAAVQMTSTTDVGTNLDAAGQLLADAAAAGAGLAVLPENFSFMGATDADRLAAAESPGDGAAQTFLAEAAREHGLAIVGGTIPIAAEDGRARSRSLLVDSGGRTIAGYDKIHLFDVAVPGAEAETYRESATTVPGGEPVVGELPDLRIGMCVCYDLRFPGLFHRLGVLGMDMLSAPSAFTVPTGRVHWETLLKCRAVESLVYVVAGAQVGEHAGGRRTYGHAMIVDPWGEVLAERGEGPGIVTAEIDMHRLRELRERFPVIRHRREL